MLEIERGSTRLQCVGNSSLKTLWTCHKQLRDDLKEKRGCWKSKEGALDCSVCGKLVFEDAMDLS